LNWPLLVNLNEFKKIGCPILIGASRKRFLSSMCGEDNINWRKKDKATAIISLLSFLQNAWGVRVHDVKTTVSLLKKFNEN
jgi:dihydropteroate synthase